MIDNIMMYVEAIPLIVTVCSAIAAMTETPKDDVFFAKLYKLIDLFALNFGKAKQTASITKED